MTASNGQVIDDGYGETFCFTALADGTYTAKLVVTDDDGGVGCDTRVITARNVVPVFDLGDDLVVDEGTEVTFLAPPIDDHGATPESVFARNGQPVADGDGPAYLFTPIDNGRYWVTLTVTDNDGDSSSDTLIVKTLNVAPTATLGEDFTAVEGDEVHVEGMYSDPGNTRPHVLQLGSGREQRADDLRRLRPDAGLRAGERGRVHGHVPGEGRQLRRVVGHARGTVFNAPPVAAAGRRDGGRGHVGWLLVGTYTDAGHDTHHSLWVIVDESRHRGGGAAGSDIDMFTPPDEGTYTATFTVTDDAGDSGSDTVTLAAVNVAPTVVPGEDFSSAEGTDVTLSATVTNRGTDRMLSYRWTVTASNGQVIEAGYGETFSFTPDDDGTITLDGQRRRRRRRLRHPGHHRPERRPRGQPERGPHYRRGQPGRPRRCFDHRPGQGGVLVPVDGRFQQRPVCHGRNRPCRSASRRTTTAPTPSR